MENIEFTIYETNNDYNEFDNHNDLEQIQLDFQLDIESSECDDVYASKYINYNLNYTKPQLIRICNFYKLSHISTKNSKDQIINEILLFEDNSDNIAVVSKRVLFWNYINELKNDKFMKKFLMW